MASDIAGRDYRRLELGRIVTKLAQAFPQGGPGTATLFTVAGGLVRVTSMFGVVSTVVASTDPVLSIGMAPTAGTAQTSGVATTKSLLSAEAGTLVTVAGAATGLPQALAVMTTAAKAGAAVFFGSGAFLANAGTITQTATTAVTGAIDWYLTYVPITDGASVS
jgi:hypothetical protein